MRRCNSREKKQLVARLTEQFGVPPTLLDGYTLMHQERRGRYYIITEALDGVDLGDARVDAMGLYFCAETPDGLRCSVEGSQLIGPHATTHFLELETEEFHAWMLGEDLQRALPDHAFYLIVHGSDYCGCGKALPDHGIVKNYLSKTRRVATIPHTDARNS